MTELKHFIEGYFGVINQADQEHIISFFEHKELKKGSMVLHADQQCNFLSFI